MYNSDYALWPVLIHNSESMNLLYWDPLDGGSAHPKASTQTGQNKTTHKREWRIYIMLRAGFEPIMSAFEWCTTVRALKSAATGIHSVFCF